jgi:hypothetical protein
VPRDEVEAAYFALLRAREDLDALRRYDDYLRAETQRLRRTVSEGEALADGVDPRLRRALQHTVTPLADAIRVRLGALEDERSRLPERLAAAEAYVEECVDEHARLRG